MQGIHAPVCSTSVFRDLSSPHQQSQCCYSGQAKTEPARSGLVYIHQENAPHQCHGEYNGPGEAADPGRAAIAIAIVAPATSATRPAILRTTGKPDLDLSCLQFRDDSLQ